ncbi:transcriptional regulator, XRE family [Streptomyces davaonensis JCM 4913]|uniref:Transcriptional regulator, XRE family n=1 Tax=Streptomyces davaonensis (strain DSM 101723 / JCM 4913 / KCC S-0913 / 768) TaxID=1214101 RepID=K4RG13_STRDJ|nr:helix-turn-helix domain-containing protein [Streptomyces davaonensis]CCK32084.1 transcriptional regulator, XRE family [Streptomyces davaonensis JCM 4913]
MRELDETAAGGPIGARLAAWRRRRELTRDDLAFRTGLEIDYLAGLETGREWVDRRGRLAALAAALRLDVADLTGQPYPPRGEEHAAVRAVAFHLRRRLVRRQADAAPGVLLEELAERTRGAARADAAGDEHHLALELPELIEAADRALAAAAGPGCEEAVRLRVDAHVLAAGLLRRLGYKDLAWMLLHRARPGTREPLPVLVEEVRLLIDLGLPEYALARADRAEEAGADWELPTLAAVAQAMAGRRPEAEQLLATAAERADGPREAALVIAARAAVAAEVGDAAEAADHVRAADHAALDGAHRSSLLVVAAAAEARHGRADEAAARLVEADAAAPLRLRLDPFARDLVAALTDRTTVQAAAVRDLAGRAGLR